jgi:predicted small lipoprotein YifL
MVSGTWLVNHLPRLQRRSTPDVPARFTASRRPLTIHPMRALLPLIALAVLLAGCGTKGPLYLPKPKPGTQKPGEPTPTPPQLPPDDFQLGDR